MFTRGSVLLKVKHLIEAAVVYPIYYLFRLTPFAVASYVVGKLLRWLGRYHRAHNIAYKNLKYCFPEKTEQEIQHILFNSWENIGRIAGELPHVASWSDNRMREICSISGLENLESARKYANEHETGLMMVSAHLGNWELASRMLLVIDPDTALIYRKANNPYVDKLIQKLRGKYTDFIIPKGDMGGIRDIIKHLRKGGRLGMLTDQKISDGGMVNFFGKQVLAPLIAGEFCIKYNMPVVCFRVVRNEMEKTSFIFKMEQPIYPEGHTVSEITQMIYDHYERWIREYPNQWFWQHNRFDLGKKR
jgi:KDO2-lipid IV(A) lauroyltransferase